MLVWRDWVYRPVAADLSIGDVIDEPDTWRTGTRSLEATIETLLAFNLSTLVGMPIWLVRRAFPIEPAADIVYSVGIPSSGTAPAPCSSTAILDR